MISFFGNHVEILIVQCSKSTGGKAQLLALTDSCGKHSGERLLVPTKTNNGDHVKTVRLLRLQISNADQE